MEFGMQKLHRSKGETETGPEAPSPAADWPVR